MHKDQRADVTAGRDFGREMSSRLRSINASCREHLHSVHGQRLACVALVVSSALLIVAIALDFGVWTRTEVIIGPFATDVSGGLTCNVLIGAKLPFALFVDSHGDTLANPRQSDLILELNGVPLGPPHSLHAEIRSRGTPGYSHWSNLVLFSIPQGIANNATAVLTATYSIHLKRTAHLTILIVWLLVMPLHLIRLRELQVHPRLGRFALRFLNGISDLPPIAIRIAVALGAIYAASILYGLAAGFALPTIALLDLSPGGDLLARAEVALPRAILLFAAVGGCLGWLAYFGLFDQRRLRRNEIKTMRLLGRWGLPLTFLLFVFSLSNGGWAGRFTAEGIDYMSFGGLVPHSDAQAYWTATFGQIETGSWNWVASQRPLAAASRQLITILAGFSYVGTLLVQAALISVGLFFAARSLVLWRGVWVGLAFYALCYLVARPFLTTMLTEPLALVWALGSVVFLIDALRIRSAPHALVGLCAFTIAMWVRMGAVLTIPAYILWLVFGHHSTLRGRAVLLTVATAAVGAVLLAGKLSGSVYGDPTTSTGENFAYVACGFAAGGTWETCPKMFSEEISKVGKQTDGGAFLYTKARVLFFQDPTMALRRAYDNVGSLLGNLATFLLYGYSHIYGEERSGFLWVLAIPGLVVFGMRITRDEAGFWLLMLAGTISSATIIFSDDGWRVMQVSWVLIALFTSFGFMSPVMPVVADWRRARPIVSARAGSVTIFAAAALTLVSPLISDLWWHSEFSRYVSPARAADASEIVVSGRSISGFLIIPDDRPAPRTVPSMHLSVFSRIVRSSHLERDYGSFLATLPAKIPIAFLSASPIGVEYSERLNRLFLAPTEMLTDRHVLAWRVLINHDTRDCMMCKVAAAEPLP